MTIKSVYMKASTLFLINVDTNKTEVSPVFQIIIGK